jgi:hypothetical protein
MLIQVENETTCVLVGYMEREYLGVADVDDANPEFESESAPRCTRRDTQEHSHTRMVWGWESIGEPIWIRV